MLQAEHWARQGHPGHRRQPLRKRKPPMRETARAHQYRYVLVGPCVVEELVCCQGVNPEALAAVIKELRREAAALKVTA